MGDHQRWSPTAYPWSQLHSLEYGLQHCPSQQIHHVTRTALIGSPQMLQTYHSLLQSCSWLELRLIWVRRNYGHYVVRLPEAAADVDAWQFSIQGILSDFCCVHILVVYVFHRWSWTLNDRCRCEASVQICSIILCFLASTCQVEQDLLAIDSLYDPSTSGMTPTCQSACWVLGRSCREDGWGLVS